jgi:hypothetical protein
MILTNHSSFFEEIGLTSFTTLQNPRNMRRLMLGVRL